MSDHVTGVYNAKALNFFCASCLCLWQGCFGAGVLSEFWCSSKNGDGGVSAGVLLVTMPGSKRMSERQPSNTRQPG